MRSVNTQPLQVAITMETSNKNPFSIITGLPEANKIA